MRAALFLWSVAALPFVMDALSLPATTKTTPKQTRTFLHRLDRFLTRLQDPQANLQDHIYLSGNYAPVTQEHVNVPVEVVEGELPSGLEGMLCRNGPNPVHLEKPYHWFDGHAMLHNLRFDADGAAFYTNQFVPCTRYQLDQQLDESFMPNLGEYNGFVGLIKLIMHPSMVSEKSTDIGKTSSPPNTANLLYRNRFYCLNEGNVPLECVIRPDGTLSKDQWQWEYFEDSLDYAVSAHPRVDVATGDLYFHSYTVNADCLARDGPIKVGRYNAKSQRVENYFGIDTSVDKDDSHVSFCHNLLLTDDYLIVYDCSVHFDPKALFEGGSFFRSNPNYNLRFGVMRKGTATSSDDVVWYDTGEPGGIVHPLNSWQEDDGTIVIWTPWCESLELDLETKDLNEFCMVEYRLDTKSGRVAKRLIDDSINVEFSVVGTNFGSFTQYGYTAIQSPDTPGEGSFSGFAIWDMVEGKLADTVCYPDGLVGGEPTVITSSNNKEYIGVYLQDLKPNQSYFALYDQTELVARLKMPYRVPFGFHGMWMSLEELQGHWRYHGLLLQEVLDDLQ